MTDVVDPATAPSTERPETRRDRFEVRHYDMTGGALSRRSLLGAGAVGAAAGLVGAAGLAGPAGAAVRTAVEPDSTEASPVGYVLAHEQFPGPRLVDWSTEVERAGFDEVWTSDHIQPWQDNEGHATHPWLTQALIGERTKRITFGTGVTCPTYRHHPSEVAQAFATLGVFNPGRVFLGVGAGEALNEQASTGQFGKYPERAARLSEAVQLIRELWTGKRTSWDGDYYKTVDMRIWDLPPLPVPIYIAASGPKSAYLAGRYGDGWICGAKDIATPSLRAAFAQGATDAGKDPAKMPKLVEQFVVVDPRYAKYTADLWRFTVDAWTSLVYDPNPVSIRKRAVLHFSREKLLSALPVGTDPKPHITALQKILDLGGTPFVHSAEPDQRAVMRFYQQHVLGKVSR